MKLFFEGYNRFIIKTFGHNTRDDDKWINTVL